MAQSISINTTTSHFGTAANTTVLRRVQVRWLSIPLFVGLLSVFMLQLWLHTTRASATYDEPFHLLAGYRYLQCGDYGINPEHPPLPKILAALPIVIATRAVVPPAMPCGSKVTAKAEGFLAGSKFVAENGVERILTPARVAMSLTALFLAVIVFLAAREMFGPVAGFVAMALLVFEPNFIAHGALVTTDMAITATMFAAVYAVYRYRQKPGKLRLLIVAIAIGLMLASKHSALVILPVLVLLVLTDILVQRFETQRATFSRRKILHGAVAVGTVAVIALTILWAGYGFRYYALPNANEKAFALAEFQNLPATTRRVVELFETLRIFPEAYTYGLGDIAHEQQNREGKWSYFPFVFTIKSSVALLLLLPFGLAMPKLYRERRREMLFLILPAFAYFAITMTSRLNLGLRHLLPVYPFFIILAAAGACLLVRRSKIAAVVVGLLLVSHVAISARTFPNYIAFSNAFWGGVDQTHQQLTDSNVDWGQNVKLVKDYVEKNGQGRDCWFAYWGPGEVARASQPCRLMPVAGWIETTEAVDIIPPVIEGLVFLSTESLPPQDVHFASFADIEPIDFLGGSIKVYEGRFDITLAAAMSHMGRGRQLSNQRRFDEAISQNREAVALAPDHPQSHLLLGEVLAAAGRPNEARKAFDKTIELALNHEHLSDIYISRARKGIEKLRVNLVINSQRGL
jgi:4-amino-4-deoxy-L-arabinose transferase-like glycosyltransferase